MNLNLEAEGRRSQSSSTRSKSCLSAWWNQEYRHQRFLHSKIESRLFQALIIFLVILDTALLVTEILLEYVKLHYQCEEQTHETEKQINKIERAIEIAHFSSIGILIFFVLELIVKIYASGKSFWNFRRKKMEYFDGLIVIASLIVDLYSLRHTKVVTEELLTMFCVRLWRFVRIVSSVAEGIRHKEGKHKLRISKEYLVAIERLTQLLVHKTEYISEYQTQNSPNDTNAIVEHFRKMDVRCLDSYHELTENHQFTMSTLIARFTESLDGLEKAQDAYQEFVLSEKPNEM